MAYKISISPEDRTTNTYHSSALWNGKPTNEREQMRRCADYMEAALLRSPMFEVKNMQYGNMFTRVKDANEWQSDCHVVPHTNGFDGEVDGTRVHAYPSEGSQRLGKLIQDRIAPLSPGTPDILKVTPDFYELRATKMTAVLPEFAFHDNPVEAQWLIDNMETIAEETAHAIYDFYGVEWVPPATDHVEPDEATVTVKMAVLGVGSTGEQVETLQRMLNSYGIKHPCGKIDGTFGVQTRCAVVRFQEKNGLTVSGVADAGTWHKLLKG